MQFLPNKRKGFTLVEMIIYLGFFAVLITLAIESTLIMMKAFYSLRLSRDINQSITVSMERMSRELRNAHGVATSSSQSTFNTHPGRLTVLTKTSSGTDTTLEFYVDGANQLRYKEGGIEKGTLMTKNTVLTNLVFVVDNTLTPKAVKIEMSLRDAQGFLSRNATTSNTIVMRNAVGVVN